MKTIAPIALAALLGTVVAHAAPSAPEPAPKLRPGVIPGPAVAFLGVKAEALAGTGRCGEPVKQSVKLTNKSPKKWEGTLTFEGGGATRNMPNVAVEANETKIVDITSQGNLDCSKALGTFSLRVANEPSPGTPFFTKTIKPMTVKVEQGFPQPSNGSPWLRRLWLDGKCGGALSGKMGLHATSVQPQTAKIKLALGSATKEEAVQVTSANTFVTVETSLDCQSPTGVPSLEYALLDGNPTSGTLKPVIGFEAQP